MKIDEDFEEYLIQQKYIFEKKQESLGLILGDHRILKKFDKVSSTKHGRGEKQIKKDRKKKKANKRKH